MNDHMELEQLDWRGFNHLETFDQIVREFSTPKQSDGYWDSDFQGEDFDDDEVNVCWD